MLYIKTCGIWLRVVVRKKFPALMLILEKNIKSLMNFWQDFKDSRRHNMLIKRVYLIQHRLKKLFNTAKMKTSVNLKT